jgi:hypothetical protein
MEMGVGLAADAQWQPKTVVDSREHGLALDDDDHRSPTSPDAQQ